MILPAIPAIRRWGAESVLRFERFDLIRVQSEATVDTVSMAELSSEPTLEVEPTDIAVAGLIERVRRSDAGAITMVYQQHHVVIRAFAQRLVGDVDAAEDLVQEVFASLPSACARFRGDCALRTFLVSIAVNHAKNHVRAAVRRRAALARLALEPSREGEDPERDLSRSELADRLVYALDQLPLEQRVVVILAEVEERTSGEIATIVGAPEGTVRTRLFHAKRKLRELLGGES